MAKLTLGWTLSGTLTFIGQDFSRRFEFHLYRRRYKKLEHSSDAYNLEPQNIPAFCTFAKDVVFKMKVFVATFIALIFSWIDLTDPNQNTVQSVQVFTSQHTVTSRQLLETKDVLIVLRHVLVIKQQILFWK